MPLSVTMQPAFSEVAVQAAFTGGDPEYIGQRRLLVLLAGEEVYTASFLSAEASGADATFSGDISDVISGAPYTWTATLQYWDGTAWVDSDYVQTGVLRTKGSAWMHDGDTWQRGKLWVYHNSLWRRVRPRERTDEWK